MHIRAMGFRLVRKLNGRHISIAESRCNWDHTCAAQRCPGGKIEYGDPCVIKNGKGSGFARIYHVACADALNIPYRT